VRNLAELLRSRAASDFDRQAFTFLADSGEETSLTYGELQQRACCIAAHLQQCTRPGDRALLVYPTGGEFIAAFFGCLYAGVLAVPATYPKPRRPMPRLTAIARDSGALVALTTSASLAAFDLPRVAPELTALSWQATDRWQAEGAEWRAAEIDADAPAFLQYTSGSTSNPKGVVVSHANLLHNLRMILEGNGVDYQNDAEPPARRGVFWLPAYHDMGLVCGILGTIFEAGHSVMMTPTSFLQQPLRWLEIISQHRAAVSGAPNFAYEHCVRKTTPAQRAALDLSSWQVAFCSAEPIRAETLERFAEAFAPAGFRPDAFYPCYGLAEATLLAAGGRGPARPVVKRVLRKSLAENRVAEANGESRTRVQTLVGCGNALLGQQIVVADSENGARCEEDCIGEIWVKGPSVAQGYWRRPEETAEVFAARLADDHDGPFLRTGDLGFFSDGQLFITGRVKDVIIIRGLNHYPQDVEQTVEAVHPGLVFGAGSAFSLDVDGDERLVVVHELDRRYRHDNLPSILRAMRRAVVDQHDVDPHALVLIRQASLPRTTSGKVQRSLCREQFLAGELKVIEQWQAAGMPGSKGNARHGALAARRSPPAVPQQNGRPLDEGEIQRFADQVEAWLIAWLMQRGGVSDDEVMRDRPLADYGLDSLTAVELSQQLEDWLGVHVSSVVAWRYPTPAALSQFLAREACGDSPLSGEMSAALRRRTVERFEQILSEVEAMDDAAARRELEDQIPPYRTSQAAREQRRVTALQPHERRTTTEEHAT
jgi:acyl-CoA synthetase (AMP-forming)/AMP-acid ligase II/acyl carrier protein